MTDFAARVDALTIDDLRRAGSLKWTAYPDAIGAWVFRQAVATVARWRDMQPAGATDEVQITVNAGYNEPLIEVLFLMVPALLTSFFMREPSF